MEARFEGGKEKSQVLWGYLSQRSCSLLQTLYGDSYSWALISQPFCVLLKDYHFVVGLTVAHKMPPCFDVDCLSYSERKRGERSSFKLFPKNLADARLWYHRCGIDLDVSVDYFSPALFRKRFFLCSKHINPSDFITETKQKLDPKSDTRVKKNERCRCYSHVNRLHNKPSNCWYQKR